MPPAPSRTPSPSSAVGPARGGPVLSAPTVPVYMRRDGFAPVPELAELRDGPGAARIPTPFGIDAWVITRYADVREVLSDTTRFSNVPPTAPAGPPEKPAGLPDLDPAEIARLQAGDLLSLEPPEHTRLRRMLAPEFTIRRMRRLEPRIREIVDEHLDAMQRTGPPADLVADFAAPVPSLVICELLGVPFADRDEFQERSERQLDLSRPVEERVAVGLQSRAYMAELVARAQAEPGEDLLGTLVREHGGELSTDELIGIASLLLVAGHETTTNMLGLGTLALLRHPDQLAVVRDQPERVEAAVEELLRWLSVLHTSVTTKFTTTEVEIAGQRIGPGEFVMCSLSAANRDPALREDPDRLDVTRGATGHVAFGHGVHHCLGAPLARMEMRIAFPALLQRFPGLRATTDDVQFREFHIVYGLASLPVTW